MVSTLYVYVPFGELVQLFGKWRGYAIDSFIWIVFIAILLIAFLRLRSTYRRTRGRDRGREIQRKLAELRKKRDEE
ncbi:hypothetical protein LJK87_27940 [Paenibacillus sp. P25]|nr:hypothetical protein LJK87_27940 [Paenibacillus sp. P25]